MNQHSPKPRRGTLAWGIQKNQEWPHRILLDVRSRPGLTRQFRLMAWLKANFGSHYRRYWVMPEKNPTTFCVRFKDKRDVVECKLRCEELMD